MGLKHLVGRLCLAVIVLAAALGPAYAEEKTPFLGEVNADNINLRLDATISAEALASLNKGEQLEVMAEFYEWYKVRLPEKIPVYIKKTLATCINYTAGTTPEGVPLERSCTSAKVLKERVNIRAKPSESGGIVGLADKNEVLNITGQAAGWYRIEPTQNSFGWIHKKFISKVIPPPKPAGPPQEKTTEAADQEGMIVLIGTVKPYGIVFMRPATHKLISVDDRIFLLKGNRSSLNALNHHKVKVTGKILTSARGEYPVVEVKAIEVVN